MEKITEDEFMEFVSKSENGELGIVNYKLSNDVIEYIRSEIPNVKLGKEISRKIFKLIEFCNSQKPKINISARRLLWMIEAIKAMALINCRLHVADEDLKILKHALWIHAEEISTVETKIDQISKISIVEELKDTLSEIKIMHKEYLDLKNEIRTLNDKPNKKITDIQQLNKLKNHQNEKNNEIIVKSFECQEKYKDQVKNACAESKDFLQSIIAYQSPDSSVLAV